MAPVSKYMLAAAKAQGTDELALYVTDDSAEWHRAEFGRQRINEEAYTVLESTNYSIQIDVMNTNPKNPMGVLFTSNSNGTYFTRNIEYTNRNLIGNVDFEKVQGIQGIVLVNTVANGKEIELGANADKRIVTEISFDDGRTFQDLHVDDKRLHLHSVTDLSNSGRVFSSPAPGLVMGIGNTGKSLKSYEEGDLYVSDDAGLMKRQPRRFSIPLTTARSGRKPIYRRRSAPSSSRPYLTPLASNSSLWASKDLDQKLPGTCS